MIQGYQLDHSQSLRLLKTFVDNVLLEHGGLPNVLPLAVHLDQGLLILECRYVLVFKQLVLILLFMYSTDAIVRLCICNK